MTVARYHQVAKIIRHDELTGFVEPGGAVLLERQPGFRRESPQVLAGEVTHRLVVGQRTGQEHDQGQPAAAYTGVESIGDDDVEEGKARDGGDGKSTLGRIVCKLPVAEYLVGLCQCPVQFAQRRKKPCSGAAGEGQRGPPAVGQRVETRRHIAISPGLLFFKSGYRHRCGFIGPDGQAVGGPHHLAMKQHRAQIQAADFQKRGSDRSFACICQIRYEQAGQVVLDQRLYQGQQFRLGRKYPIQGLAMPG